MKIWSQPLEKLNSSFNRFVVLSHGKGQLGVVFFYAGIGNSLSARVADTHYTIMTGHINEWRWGKTLKEKLSPFITLFCYMLNYKRGWLIDFDSRFSPF